MTTFRIKRSPTSGNPATLAQGELAYSYLTNNGSNGGDTLYVGTGTETAGNAANHVKIGGLYYTTQIDNATSSNTASTIVKRDSSGNFTAGTITAALTGNASTASKWFTARNLSLTGDATATLSSVDGSADVSAALTLANVNSNVNTLTITAASGNGSTVTLTYATQASNPYTVGQQITVTGVSPSGYNGTYTVTAVSTTQVQFASTYTTSYVSGGTVTGLFGSATYIPVITVNAKGLITAISNQAISTTLSLAAGGGTTGSVNLLSGTFTVSGGAGIATSVSGSTITISSTGAGGYTTTITSASTYTLTATSTPAQYFTGSTTQTVALPSTSGLSLGQEFILTNNSTANLSVQTSSTAAVLTQIPGTTVSYTVISTSGNTAAAWNYEYTGFANVTGTGNAVLANAPTITGHPTIEGVTSTGATGTGNLVFSAAPTITGHPTIEGVTSTGATGTGNLVFSASPTFTGTLTAATVSISGHVTVEGVTSTGATGTGKFVFDTSPTISGATLTNHVTVEGVTSTGATGTGNLVFSAAPTITGHPTIEGVTSTGATGTGNLVFSAAPTITGHPTIEGVTSTGATGTGNLVFSASPTLTGTTKLGDISIASDTISNSTAATNIIIAPTGKVQFGSGTLGSGAAYQFPAVDSTNSGYVLTSQANGTLIWAAASSSLSLAGTGSTSGATNLLTGTLTFAGGTNVTAAISGTSPNATVTISVGDATTSTKGIASFNSTYFSVTSGAVSPASTTGTGGFVLASSPTITSPSVTTSLTTTSTSFDLVNTTATTVNFAKAATTISIGAATGTTTVNNALSVTGHVTVEGVTSTGATGTGKFVFDTSPTISAPTVTGHPTIEGVTSTGATGTGNLVFSASPTLTGTVGLAGLSVTTTTISNTATNGTVTLAPSGTGTVDVSSKRITNVATPTQTTDAANKAYVDAATEGLNVHDSIDILADSTNTSITGATYADGTADTSGGLGIGATLTDATSGVVLVIDGYTVQQYDRVLVNAFTSTSAKYNGIYTLTTVGVSGSVKWVLTRATDFNNSTSGQVRPGDFAFVYRGTTYKSTGWVQTTIGTGTPFETIKIGTDAITWTQFSGAGTYLAGSGLQLVGTTFSVNLGTNSGLTTTGNTLQLNSTLAGNGLSYSSGTLTVTGTANRISVSSSGVDISASYVGQSTITTLGTVTSGIWNANTIASGYGGTGFSTYAAGDLIYASATNTLSKLSAASNGQILQLVSGVPTWGDLDGGTY